MKIIACFFLCFLCSSVCFSQDWSDEQLASANTANDATYLSQVEKETIMYINLARMYPQQFAQNEVQNYYGPPGMGDYVKNSPYRFSLLTELQNLQPVAALQPDEQIYIYAKCFAAEAGDNGIEGHTRINCPSGQYAECASYGMQTGRDIVLQWLIDHNTPSLGHRHGCLNAAYTKIGVSFHPHIKWKYNAVADFK